MKENVFRIGDVVYHYAEGEGVVKGIDTSSIPYRIGFKRGECFWCSEKTLSFAPWNAPNHTRPIEEGWWIVRVKAYSHEDPVIREFRDSGLYAVSGHLRGYGEQYEFIRFLGKDWRGAA